MKIIIPSYNRALTIKSHKLLENSNFDWKVVVHSAEQFNEYMKIISKERLICSGVEPNISKQRNWIRNNLVKDGEWFCMMDDNIEKFNMFPNPYYMMKTLNRTHPEFKSLRTILENNYIDAFKLEECFQESIFKAEEINAAFIGFATIENYFFRNKKWKTISMICSKCCLIKNDELRYDENVLTMDDYEYSIKSMIKYGKVLVNSYIFPNAHHNQSGGLGKLSERAEKKVKDCFYITNKYPGLFRFKNRVNSVPNGEICLKFYKETSFANWRSTCIQV